MLSFLLILERDDEFMQEAIREAQKSLLEGGIPIGSVLIKNGKVIGRGHNRRVQKDDPTAHAEIECLRNAGRIRRHKGTILYSTLMPCYMCAGAVVQFGIERVIVGESRSFSGAKEFMEEHGVEVIDLDNEECYQMLQSFIEHYPEIWKEDKGG
jgi:cytosine deaminase